MSIDPKLLGVHELIYESNCISFINAVQCLHTISLLVLISSPSTVESKESNNHNRW